MGANNATSLMLEDAPQPELSLLMLPEYGGRSGVEGLYFNGPLEFVAEIAASSASNDLHDKYDLYQSAGVDEYPPGTKTSILSAQGFIVTRGAVASKCHQFRKRRQSFRVEPIKPLDRPNFAHEAQGNHHS